MDIISDGLSSCSNSPAFIESRRKVFTGSELSTKKVLNLGEPTSMDLHISSEIQEYLSREEYFSYALHSVLGIIENRLRAIDRPYKVEVKLETDLFDPKSEHSDITVRIKEKDYKRILDLWDDVGSSVGSFLKSLRDGSTMPEAAADRLYDFINIIFAPDF